jgi:hypothetical protein
MNTLEIERRLLAQISAEDDELKRKELKEQLNTLLQIDIDKYRDSKKIEDLTVKLAIWENL